MPKRNRYREFGLQADEIEKQGVPVENPCEHCLRRNLLCIMDSKSRNCAACTRRGRKCEKRFHSEGEWKRLNRDRDALTAQIDETENQIEALFARLKSLKTRRKFLDSRGKKMLDHDTVVMDRLNEEDPLGPQDLQELDRIANDHEAAALAASDNPSLSQLWNDASLWANVDFSANDIAGQVGGSPSGSR
jgi:predicted RNase H-like nuclease (RuvC/YqgF family)